jgi:GNAT superfamily N-acetyltransferase
VNVRSAEVGDAAAIARIHTASWQVAYAGQLPDDFLRNISVESREQAWARRLRVADHPGVMLVVEDESVLAGFVALNPSRDGDAKPDTAELQAIYLHPDRWGRGLGQLLHDRAMAALADRGYRDVTLWVLETNARARRFYGKAGWSPDGATKTDTIADGAVVLDEVRYRKPL